MKSKINIRTYRNDDLEGVITLWRACDLVVPWNNPKADIARKVKVDRDLFLVGEQEGEIVVTVMAGYEGHRGWINYLAVAPHGRRSGLGRMIMQEAEKRMRAKGCPKINLQVRATNKDVLSFYQALGYKVDEVVSLGKRLEED